MKCKFCDAELEDGITLCPVCGRDIADTQEEAVPVAEACRPSDCDCGHQEDCACEENVQKQPAVKSGLKGWKLGLLIAGCVVLAGIIVGAVLYGLGIDFQSGNKNSYTARDAVLNRKADVVVATVGDEKLTNGELQIYYAMQVSEFLRYYGSALGEDVKLDEEMSGDMTYQQRLLEIALESWRRYETMCLLAKEDGFVLSQEQQEFIDSIPQQVKEIALTSYDSVEEFLKEQVCPGTTEQAYIDYNNAYYKSYYYVEAIYDELVPSDVEIEAYFAENEKTFTDKGVTKESGMIADVRHILICPEGGTKDENGMTTYTEAEWEKCLEEAEKLLEQWKQGEATEESFAKLANEHSEDGGSNTTGGLYTDITPTTNFVPNFLNWSIDENRQVGDTGIVESPYGYHIMYYVAGEPIWKDAARSNFVSEQTNQMLLKGMERWPMEVDYKKIVLFDVD